MEGPNLELPPQLPQQNFRESVKEAIRKFMDPEHDSSRAVEFFLNRLSVNTQIRFGLFVGLLDLEPKRLDIGKYIDPPEFSRDGELFDSSRETMNMIISRLFGYPQNQTEEEKENMRKFGRAIYSYVIGAIVKKSTFTSDEEFKKSLKGIAWSIMAKDVDKTLIPKGQKRLSSQWKNQMRTKVDPIVNTVNGLN